MDDENLQKAVIDVVSEQLGVDPKEISLDKSFVQDLNADSLDQTELFITFEDQMGVKISDEEAASLHTVGDAVNLIRKKNPKKIKGILQGGKGS